MAGGGVRLSRNATNHNLLRNLVNRDPTYKVRALVGPKRQPSSPSHLISPGTIRAGFIVELYQNMGTHNNPIGYLQLLFDRYASDMTCSISKRLRFFGTARPV